MKLDPKYRWPRRFGLALAAIMVVVAPFSAASAQEDIACNTCLDKNLKARWTNLLAAHAKSATRLERVRNLLADAESTGNTLLADKLRDVLAKVEAQWREIDGTVRALESPDYRARLVRQKSFFNNKRDRYIAKLHDKTDQFRRLREGLNDQRDTAVREMMGIARHERAQRFELGINSAIALTGGLSEAVPKMVGKLRGVGGRFAHAVPERQLRALSRAAAVVEADAPGALKAVGLAGQAGKVRYEVSVGRYADAALDISETVVGELASATGKQAFKSFAALPSIAGISLDLASLAQSHHQFRQAEGRLDSVLAVENSWRIRVTWLGDSVRDLRKRAGRADKALAHQTSLKSDARRARREVAP